MTQRIENGQWAYRLVEVKNGQPHTLFHAVPVPFEEGIRRSRKLQLGRWLRAEQKTVTDGTSTSVYTSGFNALLDLDAMRQYRQRFKKARDLRIAKVRVNLQLRPKAHSRAGVWLADWMMVPENWEVVRCPYL